MLVAWDHALTVGDAGGFMTTQDGPKPVGHSLLGREGVNSMLGTHDLLPRQLSHMLWKSWHLEDMRSQSSRVHPANEELYLPMPPPAAWALWQQDHSHACGQLVRWRAQALGELCLPGCVSLSRRSLFLANNAN